MDSFHSYPSIFALGHKAVADLLTVPVYVTEKIDGSQFSFGIDEDGIWYFRSKGKEIYYPDGVDKMFQAGVDAIVALEDKLVPGWTYRGEYLSKPKHGVLAYDRVPNHHVIIFDINDAHESFLDYGKVIADCMRIGFEVVPSLGGPYIPGDLTLEILQELLTTQSVLGGQLIEGVVVKPLNYNLFGRDKKVLMGKFVSEKYKEILGGEWRAANPIGRDVIDTLIAKYRTPARWQKGIQHLRDEGTLEGSPRDIGLLLKEVGQDILKECEDEIKDALFKWAWPQIQRGVTRGLPEWYKEELLKEQFQHGNGK